MQYGGINTDASKVRYHESSPLRDLRDADSTGKQWKRNLRDAAQNYSNQQALSQVTRAVEKIRRRVIGMPPVAQNLHPFQIYQPTNFASFTTGTTFLGTDGTPTTCNIDANVPTNFANSPPTVNPKTDAWRFWAVRTGAIETRPIYTIGPFSNADTPDSSQFGVLTVCTYCDGNGMSETNIMETQTSPLILSGSPTPGQSSWYDFWIRIQPDPPNSFPILPQVAITPNLNSGNTFGGTTANSPTQIFIGVVMTTDNTGIPNYTEQILYGHATGRFPCGNGNFLTKTSNSPTDSPLLGGSVLNFRGSTDGVSTYAPTDLNMQIMYPGDVVLLTGATPHWYMFNRKYPLIFSTGGGPPFSGAWTLII